MHARRALPTLTVHCLVVHPVVVVVRTPARDQVDQDSVLHPEAGTGASLRPVASGMARRRRHYLATRMRVGKVGTEEGACLFLLALLFPKF